MMNKLLKPVMILAFFLAVSLLGKPAFAQGVEVDYSNPKSYVVGGIEITGLKYLSAEQLIAVLGFREGDSVTLPSEDVSNAIKRLWLQGATSNVGLYIERLSPAKDTAWLRLDIEELPRVLKWEYRGVRNGERDDLKEKLNLRRGGQLSEYVLNTSVDLIKEYFKEKGFLNVAVDVEQVQDSVIKNASKVTFVVDKGKKVKIREITYEGEDP